MGIWQCSRIRILALCGVVATLLPLFGTTARAQTCGCLDVAFVVDDTGSMGPAIANVVNELNSIITAAEAASGGDVRFGLITFKDSVEVDVPLTTDLMAVGTAISGLVATGGSGVPEASDEALRFAVTGATSCGVSGGTFGDFRSGCTPIAVLITDALPGGCDDAYVNGVDNVAAANVAAAAKVAGVRVSAVYVPTSGVNPTTLGIMTNYATVTQGVYQQTAPNGQGTGQALKDIVTSCGGAAPRTASAPAMAPSVLIVLATMLAIGGGLRLRSTTQEGGVNHAN